MDELKTGKFRNTKNRLAREFIEAFVKWREVKHEFKNEPLVLDVISDMVENNYMTADFDENNDVVYKRIDYKDMGNQLSPHFNAKLTSTTNKYISEKYKGINGYLSFNEKIFRFFGRYNEMIFRSSLIVSFEKDNKLMKVKTMNSEYIFELLKDIETDSIVLSTNEEVEFSKAIALHMI